MTPSEPAVLLDVNLLTALAWPKHLHHSSALDWWEQRSSDNVSWATKIRGHRQVTDALLVALALEHSGRVATFDRGMPDVVPQHRNADDVVEVIQ